MNMFDYLWLCMPMYDYVWVCITMYDHLWLRITMFDYVRQFKLFHLIQMFSHFSYFSTNLDFVFLCLHLFISVYLCSNDASMHKFHAFFKDVSASFQIEFEAAVELGYKDNNFSARFKIGGQTCARILAVN